MKKYQHPAHKRYFADTAGNIYGKRGAILKPVIGAHGYAVLSIYLGGGRANTRRVGLRAHRFIWECYTGTPIPKGLQINHINGVKTDNRISNLELVTPSENVQHAFATGLNRGAPGEENPMARLTEEEVRSIIKDIINGVPNGDLSTKYGIPEKHVSLIRNKKRWKHLFTKEFPDYTPIHSKNFQKTNDTYTKHILHDCFLTGMSNRQIEIKHKLASGSASRIRNYKLWRGLTKPFIQQSSETIPEGSRTKWFEAVTILI